MTSLLAQLVKNLPTRQETQVQEDPWEKGMATHSSILAWRISWSRVSYSPWDRRDSDTIELLTLTFLPLTSKKSAGSLHSLPVHWNAGGKKHFCRCPSPTPSHFVGGASPSGVPCPNSGPPLRMSGLRKLEAAGWERRRSRSRLSCPPPGHQLISQLGSPAKLERRDCFFTSSQPCSRSSSTPDATHASYQQTFGCQILCTLSYPPSQPQE